MPIDIETLNPGDTNYISKHNSNYSRIAAAIAALQAAIAGIDGGLQSASFAAFVEALFNGSTALIATNSYFPTPTGTQLSIAPGAAFKQLTSTVVQSLLPTLFEFSGQGGGTYYIIPDGIGTPARSSTFSADAIYSVVWTGSAFGSITRLVPALFDVVEENNSRNSAAAATIYTSLDARLEAIEAVTVIPRYRKVGISLDGGGGTIPLGVMGAIQIDFNGTIVGWSCIADQIGQLAVEVDVARTSPVSAPPTDPPIPNTTTDKISGTEPVLLDGPSGQQSAAATEAEITSWTTDLQQWDVVQFNVVTCINILKATLYLRILES